MVELREIKGVTGIDKCQCRKEAKQKSHIGLAYLLWIKLKEICKKLGISIYNLKERLLDRYMFNETKNPSVAIHLRSY